MLKKIILGLALTLIWNTASFADGWIQLNAGSTALIQPGERVTVSCQGGGAALVYKCTLAWYSTMGTRMPDIYGEGLTKSEALSTIRDQCPVQPGSGNAAKCAQVYTSAQCKLGYLAP